VLTDGDNDKEPAKRGAARATRLLELLEAAAEPAERGIFVGTQTFEYDLLVGDQRNISPCFDTLKELCKSPSVQEINSWAGKAPGHVEFLKVIDNAGGKGRYAQRLALREVYPPQYLTDALQFLERQE
jgi:putative ATP-dependent endonuclease of OLD family